MFTYSGWNAAAYMAEEIRDPGRNVPRALLMGTIGVIIIYALLNMLYLYAMPVGELAAVKGSVFDFIGERMLGARAGDILAHRRRSSAWQPASMPGRSPDRACTTRWRATACFFRRPRRCIRSSRRRTPRSSRRPLWASILILTGSLDALANYVGFAIILFAGIAVAAVFVLRAREPNAPRPYKTLGYPDCARDFRARQPGDRLNAHRTATHGPSGSACSSSASGIPLYRVADTPAPLTRRWGSRFLFHVPRSRWAGERSAPSFFKKDALL